MKPLLILAADNECVATLRGFFERKECHKSLGCGPIQLAGVGFDCEKDIRIHPGHDCGVWKDPQLVLLPEKNNYDKTLIILDEAWDGAPSAADIIADIEKRAEEEGGWQRDRFEVILIRPELEAWIWQRNVHVAEAFEFPGADSELWELLNIQALALDKRTKKHSFIPFDGLNDLPAWPKSDAKPRNPKGVVEAVSIHCRSGPASGIFNEISSKVSVKGCVDEAFGKLRDTLRLWFPKAQDACEK
jgi:hypothetical protein